MANDFVFKPTQRVVELGKPYSSPKPPQPVSLILRDVVPDFSSLQQQEGLGLYPSTGSLAKKLAEKFSLQPENITVTAGGDDALLQIISTTIEPGKNLVVAAPTFTMIPRYVTLVGGEFRTTPWLAGDFPLDNFLSLIDKNTGLVVFVSPNNPTGRTVPLNIIQAVRKAAPDAVLVLDGVYLEYANQDITNEFLAMPGTVTIRSFSKAYGVPALRVGYALSMNPQIIGAMRIVGQPYGTALPALAAAEELLSQENENKFQLARQVVKENGRKLMQKLDTLKINYLPSEANFILVQMPTAEQARLLRNLLAGLGIDTRGFDGDPLTESCLRMGVPYEQDQIQFLLTALDACLAPQALIFDMDGVMADVSQSQRMAIVETVRAFGGQAVPDDVAKIKAEGDANNDWIITQRLLARQKIDITLDKVTEKYQLLYNGDGAKSGLYQIETLLIPRTDFIRLKDMGFKLNCVTGRPRDEAERFLQDNNLSDLFPAKNLVCMGEAKARKPDPSPILLGLEKLGARTAWYFGDTPDDAMASRGVAKASNYQSAVVPIGCVAPGDQPEITQQILLQIGAAVIVAQSEFIALVQKILNPSSNNGANQ